MNHDKGDESGIQDRWYHDNLVTVTVLKEKTGTGEVDKNGSQVYYKNSV